MRSDTHANVERLGAERPPHSRDDGEPHPLHGWWPGGAGEEIARWRTRALRAEAELRAIRADIAAEVRRRRGFAT